MMGPLDLPASPGRYAADLVASEKSLCGVGTGCAIGRAPTKRTAWLYLSCGCNPIARLGNRRGRVSDNFHAIVMSSRLDAIGILVNLNKCVRDTGSSRC